MYIWATTKPRVSGGVIVMEHIARCDKTIIRNVCHVLAFVQTRETTIVCQQSKMFYIRMGKRQLASGVYLSWWEFLFGATLMMLPQKGYLFI